MTMKNQSWLRKNWLWVAAASFLGIHVGTWLMQKAMKSSAHSQTRTKQKSVDE